VRDDLEVMQGLWRLTSYDTNGRPMGNHAYKVRIRGNRWTFISTSDVQERETASYEYNLDYKVEPRAFEWRSGGLKGKGGGSGWVGSYRLEDRGKRMTIVFNGGTLDTVQSRPVDFGGAKSYKMTMEHIGRE
jgi:uncharacterized protein (TIGR03067 family)